MADVSRLMKMARKRSKEDKAASQARFKEILAIVKKYDLKDGLTPETRPGHDFCQTRPDRLDAPRRAPSGIL